MIPGCSRRNITAATAPILRRELALDEEVERFAVAIAAVVVMI